MKRTEGIKRLRADFNVPISLATKAFDAAEGDMIKAADYILANWQGVPNKTTNNGLVYTYHHPRDTPRIGVMLEARCGSDFVAKSEAFSTLCRELALQLVAGLEGPLESQAYVRDSSRTVENLLAEYSQKLGETICVQRSVRWEFGTDEI